MNDQHPSQPTLGQHLAAQRARFFVGREHELSAFEAFATGETPHRLWFISAAGGTGKSTLLKHMAERARAQGLIFLDASRIDPNPPAVRAALSGAANGDSLRRLCDSHARPLLLIDTFEYWQQLTDWVHQEWLPALPQNLAVIIAGRNPPPAEWCTSDGTLATELPLLSEADALRYLQRRAIPAPQAAALAAFANGNALALAMAADAAADGAPLPTEDDDSHPVHDTLLDNFADWTATSEQRLALDACAIAYQLDARLLACMLDQQDVDAQFEWLAQRSDIKTTPGGLQPHDMVRQALISTMDRRAPGRYETLAPRVTRWAADRIENNPRLSFSEAANIGAESMYALRRIPLVKYYFFAEGHQSLYFDRPRDASDWQALAEMTRRHEGDESCAWFEFWRQRYPENVIVIRGIRGQARAYLLRLDMEELDPEDRHADPLTRTFWQAMNTAANRSNDDHIAMFRFWLNHDYAAHTSPEKTQMLMHINTYNLTAPRLRYTGMVFPQLRTGYFTHHAAKLGMYPVETEPMVGDACYRIFYHDFTLNRPTHNCRNFGVNLMRAQRAIAEQLAARPQPSRLSRSAFANAVREALPCLARPAQLVDNPLAGSALVLAHVDAEASDPSTRTRALAQIFQDTVARMQTNPESSSQDQMGDVLAAAYLWPTRNQKEAAAALSMSYSSYRRMLAQAREILIETLWSRELSDR